MNSDPVDDGTHLDIFSNRCTGSTKQFFTLSDTVGIIPEENSKTAEEWRGYSSRERMREGRTLMGSPAVCPPGLQQKGDEADPEEVKVLVFLWSKENDVPDM